VQIRGNLKEPNSTADEDVVAELFKHLEIAQQ
jgi:hypothetical protein